MTIIIQVYNQVKSRFIRIKVLYNNNKDKDNKNIYNNKNNNNNNNNVSRYNIRYIFL